MTDIERLSKIFPYCSDAGSHCSWIDDILCTPAIDNLIGQCNVHYEFVSSDHKPLGVTFRDLIPESLPMITQSSTVIKSVCDWFTADEFCIYSYQNELDESLRKINIPVGNNESHVQVIDD